MGKRRATRRGVAGEQHGVLAPPDPDGVAGRSEDRHSFLEALSEYAPVVLRELELVPVPLVLSTGDHFAIATLGVEGCTSEEYAAGASTEGKVFRDALIEWAKKWGLTEPWILKVAVQSVLERARSQPCYQRVKGRALLIRIAKRARNGERKGRLIPSHGADVINDVLPLQALNLSLDSVEELMPDSHELPAPISAFPERETKEAFLRRAGEHFEATRTAFEEAGWSKAPEGRQPGNDALRHYRWLVRRHVLGWTFEAVAKEEGVSPQAVKNACSRLGRRIGIREGRRRLRANDEEACGEGA